MTKPIYDIFISYSRKDIHRVNRLISDLKARLPELKYWYDIDGIESADEFVEKMVSAIDRSKFVLFVASDNSMESKWTKDEVSYALNTNKKVIPAIINDTILRGWFLFRLGRIDCINADIPTQFDKLVRDLASWCNYHISGPGLTSTAPRQMPASDIFISYSRKDSAAAAAICAILNEANLSYWIDVNGIYSGENYKDSIVKAIKGSKIVLFLSSENSNKSAHVAKEIGIADKYNKVIIPIRLDTSAYNPKMDYDLSSIDAIDFTSTDDKNTRKLHAAIIAQIRMNNGQ